MLELTAGLERGEVKGEKTVDPYQGQCTITKVSDNNCLHYPFEYPRFLA